MKMGIPWSPSWERMRIPTGTKRWFTSSTCKEILDKGGKRGKLDFGDEVDPLFYVSLDGLYFFFDDQEGVENGKIKPDAPCIKISNSENPYFM